MRSESAGAGARSRRVVVVVRGGGGARGGCQTEDRVRLRLAC